MSRTSSPWSESTAHAQSVAGRALTLHPITRAICRRRSRSAVRTALAVATVTAPALLGATVPSSAFGAATAPSAAAPCRRSTPRRPSTASSRRSRRRPPDSRWPPPPAGSASPGARTAQPSRSPAAPRPSPAPEWPDTSATLTATYTVGSETRSVDDVVRVAAQLDDATTVQRDLAAIAIPNVGDIRTNVSMPSTGTLGSSIAWSVVSPSGATVRDGSAAGPVPSTSTARRPVAPRSTWSSVRPRPADPSPAHATSPSGCSRYPRASRTPRRTSERSSPERVTAPGASASPPRRATTRSAGARSTTASRSSPRTWGRRAYATRSSSARTRATRSSGSPPTSRSTGSPVASTPRRSRGSTYIEVWESTDLVNWSRVLGVEHVPNHEHGRPPAMGCGSGRPRSRMLHWRDDHA